MSGRLTDGFRDIIELRWSELVEIEQSLDGTNFDSIVTGIARACKKGNLRAIQVALDRLDGKIAMELEVEYPKFYILYPNATKTADDTSIIEYNTDNKIINDHGKLSVPEGDAVISLPVGAPADIEEQEAMEQELPTGSLRAVLERMLDSPKSLVSDIISTSEKIDAGDYSSGDPMVKSVIIAGLMKLVHDGRISAVFEVFDQIDGKVADKIKVLGDTYVKRYDLIAPAGAEKNEDGIYQIVSPIMTDVWGSRLEQLGKGKR